MRSINDQPDRTYMMHGAGCVMHNRHRPPHPPFPPLLDVYSLLLMSNYALSAPDSFPSPRQPWLSKS